MNNPKKKVSAWKEKAEFRLKNRKWLNYSSNIARRIAAIMDERKDLNQKSLAELMDVKPQYISRLLKGEENLTLETIAKLSTVLEIELIEFPDYKYSLPVQESNGNQKKDFDVVVTKNIEKIIINLKQYYIQDYNVFHEFLYPKKFSPTRDISVTDYISADKSKLEMCN